MTAIYTGRRDDVQTIERLIGWPDTPSADWRKGFLAGIFDAEGSYSRGILRIGNTDRTSSAGRSPHWTCSALMSLWSRRAGRTG